MPTTTTQTLNCGCCGANSPCCAGVALPKTLYVSITGCPACPGFDGPIPLTYDPSYGTVGAWSYAGPAICDAPAGYPFVLQCNYPNPDSGGGYRWLLQCYWTASGGTTFNTSHPVTCSPFYAEFAFASDDIHLCYMQTLTAIVTE